MSSPVNPSLPSLATRTQQLPLTHTHVTSREDGHRTPGNDFYTPVINARLVGKVATCLPSEDDGTHTPVHYS